MKEYESIIMNSSCTNVQVHTTSYNYIQLPSIRIYPSPIALSVEVTTQSTTPLGSWRWRTSRWRWAHRPQYVDGYRNIWDINWYQLQSTTSTINYNIYSYMMIYDTSVYSFAFLECHDVSWVMTVPNTSLTSSVHGSVLLVEPGQGNLSIGKVYRIQPRTVTLHHQLVEPTGFHHQALAQTALADAFRSRFNVFYCCSTLRVRFTCPEG